MTAVDWIGLFARALGLFYLAGGILVLRALVAERIADALLLHLEGRVFGLKDALRLAFLGAGAIATSTAGLALALAGAIAAPLFLANAVVQAGWLLYASRAFPPEDAEDGLARRRTVNAFLGWLAATALVIWLGRSGRLAPVDLVQTGLVAALAAILAVWLLVMLRGLFRTPSPASEPRADDEAHVEQPAAEPFVMPARIRLAPELGASPVWDDDTDLNIDPHQLPISPELLNRLYAFDDRFTAVANHVDFSVPVFAGEQDARAFDEEARRLAAALARELAPVPVRWPTPLRWALADRADGPLRSLQDADPATDE